MNYSILDLEKDLEVFKKKLKIAVVFGGDKQREDAVIFQTFNSRSWKSYEKVAKEIAQTLKELGFEHVELFCDDSSLTNNLKENKIDFVWLNSGGVQGINPLSHTPALLEMLGIPFVGHSSINATLLDNKHLFKYMINSLNIKTAPFLVFNPYQLTPEQFLENRLLDFAGDKFEFVVKPVSGRGSVNVFYVDSKEEFLRVSKEIFQTTKDYILIEKYLSGAEYCVAVHGEIAFIDGKLTKLDEPFAFSAIERVLDEDEMVFTSMDKKPISSKRVKPLKDAEVIKKLKNLAKEVYQLNNIETLIRLDVRADEKGELYILEANPKPDLKRPEKNVASIISLGLTEYNIGYNQLILQIFANTIFSLFNYKEHLIKHIKELR